MKSYMELPEGYQEILHIDLQKDKKLMLIVNVLAAIIGVIMVVPAAGFIPLTTLFDYSDVMSTLPKVFVMCLGFVVYMVLHELVHGIFMKHYSGAKVKYGFTGVYAFAGSDAYYCRKHYVIIALAPIVVWGIVLLILNFALPISWFYVVYFIQMGNISGAAGDLYVTWRFSKLPEDILVRDTGVAMTVFSRGN
jgi:hypothetical protein